MNRLNNIRLCNLSKGKGNVSLSFQFQNDCAEISIQFHEPIILNELSLEIEFGCPIVKWRNHNYTWVDCNSDRMANYYSPKILMLNDSIKVVAGSTDGIWHYNKKQNSKLYWSLAEPLENPLFQYGENDIRNFFQVGREFKDTLTLKLFFTKNGVMEWSRSMVPFSGILCFTDHCDFDTLVLLRKQRELFDQNQIKVTKGFFQYHFSKRADNTSFEKPEEREEYLNWIKDGHELAYHSLSQSKKTDNQPFDDFNKFGLPDENIVTWIDHGYQPYNFTQIEKHVGNYSAQEWVKHVKSKGIKYLWNYLDSGESSLSLINQISPDNFTYGTAIKGIKHHLLAKRISERIRIYLFYYSDEKTLLKYRGLSSLVKNFKSKKQIKDLIQIVATMISLSGKITSALFPRLDVRLKKPDFARDAPCIFEIFPETENAITFFQTLAVKDFVHTFSSVNLETLSKEGGLCIAHTYFAFLESHHYGKMFLNPNGDMSAEIKETFKNIGQSIKHKQVWNPTFKELAEYFEKFRHIEYEFDKDINVLRIKVKPEIETIPMRII